MHTTAMHENEVRIITQALAALETRLELARRDIEAMAGEQAAQNVANELLRVRSIQLNIRQSDGLAYMQEELPR